MRVAITGGGTGGHVFPAIAVADALVRMAPGTEVLFIGGAHGLEATAVPEAGFPFQVVPARGLVGSRWLAVPAVLWTTLRGTRAALSILRRFRPDVVFATGGYVSGAVALAGVLLGKPLVLHEQNSIPGLTNRILARIAREVHLNSSRARRHFSRRGHLKLSGNPIRPALLQGDAERARREYGLERDRATILVLGGSQGARSINRAAVGAIRRLASRRDIQFILQTGRLDQGWAMQQLRGVAVPVHVTPFIRAMGDAYALADLVVARAGAMTLAEIAACGKASLLVPYPYAAHNHQEGNARAMVEVGAAEMILDRELDAPGLAQQIAKFIDTPRKLREMCNSALHVARPEAARKIAAALLRYGVVEGNGGAERTASGVREGRG